MQKIAYPNRICAAVYAKVYEKERRCDARRMKVRAGETKTYFSCLLLFEFIGSKSRSARSACIFRANEQCVPQDKKAHSNVCEFAMIEIDWKRMRIKFPKINELQNNWKEPSRRNANNKNATNMEWRSRRERVGCCTDLEDAKQWRDAWDKSALGFWIHDVDL